MSADVGTLPLSILDLAIIGKGQTAADAFANSVALAQRAEARGYERVWYAEHHNMASIASSATSVLIAHVAAHTSTIRLGAGGVMLPNHSPLTIAEQFGTLATLHPGRIDLGLGRAPGSDQDTMRAMRRDAHSSDRFPEDVLELQGYLRGESRIAGVVAVPGAGTNVPLYILGSSLFGARLAAMLGLPYAFASHFAPDCAARRDRHLPARVPTVGATRRAVRDRRRQRHRRRHRRRRAAAVGDRSPVPHRPVRRTRPRPHRRRGRRDPRIAAGPPDRADDALFGDRRAECGEGRTSTSSQRTRRSRRIDHRPLVADDRAASAFRRPPRRRQSLPSRAISDATGSQNRHETAAGRFRCAASERSSGRCSSYGPCRWRSRRGDSQRQRASIGPCRRAGAGRSPSRRSANDSGSERRRVERLRSQPMTAPAGRSRGHAGARVEAHQGTGWQAITSAH